MPTIYRRDECPDSNRMAFGVYDKTYTIRAVENIALRARYFMQRDCSAQLTGCADCATEALRDFCVHLKTRHVDHLPSDWRRVLFQTGAETYV
jgi:hypothetical protein